MTPAVVAARRAQLDFELLEYAHDSATASYGLEAAEKLGLEPRCVYKTLVVKLDGARLAVGLVAVASSMDLKAVATALKAKRAALAEPAEAERATGYVTGGISPLGQRKRLPTVIDAAVLALARVYVSAGRRGLELGLAPQDLIRHCTARVAPIARDPSR